MAAKRIESEEAPHPPVWENPLVPFALQRRLYARMVELRMLTELASERSQGELTSGQGQEACRAAVLLGLEAEDFFSDVASYPYSAWCRGAELKALVHPQGTKAEGIAFPPKGEDDEERLQRTLGMAWTCKELKAPRVTVVFVNAAETKRAVLRRALRWAARQELAMLFVVLPPTGKQDLTGKSLSSAAAREGVPGIAVEAVDTIALYRVAQESLGRARAGGGPALMESVPFTVAARPGSKPRKERPADPIALFGEMLVRGGISDRASLDQVAAEFRARLRGVKKRASPRTHAAR